MARNNPIFVIQAPLPPQNNYNNIHGLIQSADCVSGEERWMIWHQQATRVYYELRFLLIASYRSAWICPDLQALASHCKGVVSWMYGIACYGISTYKTKSAASEIIPFYALELYSTQVIQWIYIRKMINFLTRSNMTHRCHRLNTSSLFVIKG